MPYSLLHKKPEEGTLVLTHDLLDTDFKTSMGKIRGTSRMRSHFFAYCATIKYFLNYLFSKTSLQRKELRKILPVWLGRRRPPVQIRAPRPLT
jgi:hypothetical protein